MKFFLITLARLLFAGLVIFELFNYVGILHFHIEFTWLGLLITALSVWIIAELVLLRFGKHMSMNRKAVALLATSLVVYPDAIGDINRWYSYQYFDATLHFMGGSAAAILLFIVFDAIRKNSASFRVPIRWAAFVSLTSAVFLGVLYEIEEYLEDVFTGSFRLGDGPDTANDLLMNTLGALTFVLLLAYIFHRLELRKKGKKK